MVRVLSFNIEHGAMAYGLRDVLNIIQNTKADVAVLSEAERYEPTQDATKRVALALGWSHVFIKGNASAVISRWNVRDVGSGRGAYTQDKSGIVLVTPPKPRRPFFVVSVHLTDFPYQPFQATNIKYCYGKCQVSSRDSVELEKQAMAARGHEAIRTATVASRLASRHPVIIAGDFNEPSHLDWTPRAASHGLVPQVIRFPASMAFQRHGFADAFRRRYPNEVRHPGTTWPTRDPGYAYRPDRIDFVYVRNKDEVKSIHIVNTPSDHYALIADIRFHR